MRRQIYKVSSCYDFDMIPGDLFGSPDDFFSFASCEVLKLRTMLRSFFAGLWNEGDADYTDYTDFEICLDCLDVVLKPRIYANARESGFEGRRDRFAVRSALPVRLGWRVEEG